MASAQTPSTPTIDDHDVFRRANDVSYTSLGDEVLVLDVQRRRSHRLVETAAFIWLQCDGRQSVADIVRRVIGEYEVDEVTARADVHAMLGRYLVAQVIERA